jgi:hypothetical protein
MKQIAPRHHHTATSFTPRPGTLPASVTDGRVTRGICFSCPGASLPRVSSSKNHPGTFSPPLSNYINTASMNNFIQTTRASSHRDPVPGEGFVKTYAGFVNIFEGSVNTSQGYVNTLQGYVITSQGYVITLQGYVNISRVRENTFEWHTTAKRLSISNITSFRIHASKQNNRFFHTNTH